MGPVNYLGAMGVLPDPAASIRAGLESAFLERGMRQEQQLRDLQIQQAQAAQQVQGRFQKDVDGLLTDPSPEGYAAMFAKYPSFQKALSASWETRDKAAKETDLRELSGIYAAGQSGRWDVAVSALKRRIEADRAAGQETTEDEEALRIAETGTPEEKRALLGMTGVQLAATLGPDKFTEAYKELNPNQQREGKVVGDYLVDPVTGEVRFQAPTDPKYMNIDGNLVEIPGAPGIQGGGFTSFYNDFLAPAEGGFVASDGRSGAPANFGVNQAANPDIDVSSLSQEQAAQLLHDRYWVPSGADKIKNPALQAVHADTAVNMGVETAKRMLDRSGGDPNKYLQLRESRYKSLGGPDLPGWINRNQKLREYVGGELPSRSGGSPRVLFSKPKSVADSLSPAERAVDTAFAKEYVDFAAAGGMADINKGLEQLREASSALETGNLTGPIIGRTPDAILSVTNPKAISVRNAVEEVVQRNLRLILGAQFTEREGERLIQRAFNPALDEKENKKRVDRLISQIESSAKAKQNAAEYYEQNGTLKGWKGRIPVLSDFEKAVSGEANGTPDLSGGGILNVRTADEYNALPSGAQYRDPQGNLRTKR